MMIPEPTRAYLRTASDNTKANRKFTSLVCGNQTDRFIEHWASVLYGFLLEALGPFGTEPLPTILPMSDGLHMNGSTASFHMGTGEITLSPSVEGNPGKILEKLTHELVHGSLSKFPSNDEFYDEGFVDYSTWVLAHAPIYQEYRDQTIEAAALNIKLRRERAAKTNCDYDRKRWAGGFYATVFLGPMIIHRLRMKKSEGDFTW